MIVAGTGHRPNKFDTKAYSGYHPDNPLRWWLRQQIREKLEELNPDYVISGMAQGFDQDLVAVCISKRIPFIAAVPFSGQALAWPKVSQEHYCRLLNQAREVVIVCDGSYESWKMEARNQYMVDNCDVLLACFDGSPGGTANTVLYAERVGRLIVRINPKDYLE